MSATKFTKEEWEKIEEVKEIIENKKSEAEDYISERSENWVDGDRGIATQEWVDKLDETADSLDGLEEEPNYI